MRNSILALALIASTIMGGIIGGNIEEMQRAAEIQSAWDGVTVVADGTLIANPAYYADHPEELASARNVRIISNSRAAAEAAFRSED